VVAGERDRPDVARRRAQWIKCQDYVDPARLVFIDETLDPINLTPRRGWAPRGGRLIGKVPDGRWRTMTFLAALRCDRITAPCPLEGPIDGASFAREGSAAYLATKRHRHHGQSRQSRRQGRPPSHSLVSGTFQHEVGPGFLRSLVHTPRTINSGDVNQ
jgi:hypothetical protein